MPSLIERIKQQVQGKSITQMEQVGTREKSRKVIRTNRFDDLAYRESRRTPKMGGIVRDLMDGDVHSGGERPEFETAPELVEALFQAAYKAAPSLEKRRRLSKDLYATRRIIEEILEHPRLQELHEFTAGDLITSTIAVEAMVPVVKEILERVGQAQLPQPPSPQNQPGQGQGGAGQGGGQPDPNAPGQQGQGQGQGGQPQQPGQSGQPQQQQGGSGGQPDPNAQPGDPAGGAGTPEAPDPNTPEGEGNVPPPPEEKDAEEGDGSEYEQDLTEDGLDPDFDAEAEAERQEAEWEKAFDEAMDELDLDRLANKALDAAQREAEELDNLRKGIGLEDGVWAVMSPEERMAMAEQLRTPEMKSLSQIVGRMRRFALGVKATRVTDVNHVPFNVELGNDMNRVLRHQLVLLAMPETELEFYRRYASKELLQYKMHGTEEVGKGPIVICIDKSGSMNGQPFHWALGVAEALRRFASEEDRDLEVMFFGTNKDRIHFSFPKGKAEAKKIMAFMGTVANGGTQFDGVLTQALDLATNAFDGEAKGKADIVFITDGMASLSEDWIAKFNAERERVGVRVYSIYIGGAHDMRPGIGPLGLLERLSDATIPVAELRPEAVREVFERV